MQDLTTGKKYIKDIFAPNCFYNIPDYQRPYVWGRDQIVALLEDLTNAFDQSKDKEYFLGCMIWNTKKVTKNGVEYICQDILDGQQRFISIYILQGVLRDLSTDRDLKNTVEKRMQQRSDSFEGTPERDRIEFEVRDDKTFLESCVIIENSTLNSDAILQIIENKDGGVSSRNMARSVKIMHEWWKDKLNSFVNEDERQNYIYQFYAFLSTKVLALYLATPDNLDDAYNLFTVLNSRGIQLQVSDILRAQNLRQIRDDAERKRYAKIWDKCQTNTNSDLGSRIYESLAF